VGGWVRTLITEPKTYIHTYSTHKHNFFKKTHQSSSSLSKALRDIWMLNQKKPSTLQEQEADYAPQLLKLGSWNKKVIKLFSSSFPKSKLKLK